MTKRDRLAIMAAIINNNVSADASEAYRLKAIAEQVWDLDVAIGRRMKEQADRMVGIGPGPDDVDPQEFCNRFVAATESGKQWGCDRTKGHTGAHTSRGLASKMLAEDLDDG